MNATATKLWTIEELDQLPEDGIDRWVIRGELREEPMTKRTSWHSSVESRLAGIIARWMSGIGEKCGEVFSGECGLVMSRNPDTSWGVDVVYVSHEEMTKQRRGAKYLEVRPTLVVEVLSPSDSQEKIDDRIDAYHEAGIPFVWVINPKRKTVMVCRPGAEPELFSGPQDVSGEPHMPGFRVRASDIFSPYL